MTQEATTLPAGSDGAVRIDRAERLQRTLNSAVCADSPTRVTVQGAHPNLRYNSHTDTITNMDTHEEFSAASLPDLVPGDSGERIQDSGVNIAATWRDMTEKFEQRKSQLFEKKFDPKTGAESFVIQGEERKRLERELTLERDRLNDQGRIFENLQRQRERDRQAQKDAFAASLERDADLDRRALERADEEEVLRRAERIIASRRGS